MVVYLCISELSLLLNAIPASCPSLPTSSSEEEDAPPVPPYHYDDEDEGPAVPPRLD